MFRNAAANVRTIKSLLQTAERRAHDLGDEVPGPEHLLLAALDLEDGTAREALATYDVTPADVLAAVNRSHADALGATESPETRAVPARGAVYRSTGTLQQAFQRAAEISKAEKVDKRFRGAHVVIAVAELEHGTSARMLDLLGVPRQGLIESARRALAA